MPTWTLTNKPLNGHRLPWREWLLKHFAHVASMPMGARHVRLWEWAETLKRGDRPKSFVAIWPRGGGKSTTFELVTAWLCVRLTRCFVLVVSDTQEQADQRVQAISSLLERLGVQRAVNQYGTSKGWRRQQLQTANGFHVAAFGLDAGARGIKLDEFRPDLIVFDDIDALHDSAKVRNKKIETITKTLIPAGSADCGILFVQNRIYEDSIISQIADGTADFLHNREPVSEEPAVVDMKVGTESLPDGTKRYTITEGTATWEGQPLSICEQQINDWGLKAFREEANHEVMGAQGYVFNIDALNYIETSDLPDGMRKCRAWDLAATEGGGDYTVGVLMGMVGQKPNVRVYILEMERGQWGSEKVRANVKACADRDGSPKVTIHLPQDPAQAGKDQASQYAEMLRAYRPVIESVGGSKATRAEGFADAVNKGNVYLVRGEWNRDFTAELRRFREDESHDYDDQVDAASDAFNELCNRRTMRGA